MKKAQQKLLADILRGRVELWQEIDREMGTSSYPILREMIHSLALDIFSEPSDEYKHFLVATGTMGD